MCDVANLWYQSVNISLQKMRKCWGRAYVNIFACASVWVLFVFVSRLTYKTNSIGSLSMIACHL